MIEQQINSVRIYTSIFLKIYDFLVLHIFGPYVWKCDVRHFTALYERFLSDDHADIGVGTGYFLDRCGGDVSAQKITLFDINTNCLNYSTKRLKRYSPKAYVQHALSPFPMLEQEYSSICIGGLIHCLPGTMSTKCQVFDSLQTIAKEQSQIFGYTLINAGMKKNFRAEFLMYMLNALKLINNKNDSLEDLTNEISKRYSEYSVTKVGCMAFFSASKRKVIP